MYDWELLDIVENAQQ